MTETGSYRVAADVGSSCIRVGLGNVLPDGRLELLAVEQAPVSSEVRHGKVQKVSEVGDLLASLLERLQHNPAYPCRVERVLAGVNAYTMRTVLSHVTTVDLEQDEVTEALLENLKQEAIDKALPENKECLDCFEQDFAVDGYHTRTPLHERPSRLEGQYKLLVCQRAVTDNLESAFEQAGVADYRHCASLLATADALLTPDDRKRGVVLVDFGAQTTGMCIIKDEVVSHVAVLPFGGENLVQDLQLLDLTPDEARTRLLEQGDALHYTELMQMDGDAGNPRAFPAGDKAFNETVVARIEEIVENIWAQIRYSGIAPNRLGGGIVMTGGLSQLPHLDVLLKQKTNLTARMGQPDNRLSADTNVAYTRPEYACLIGLLLKAEPGGCTVQEKPREPEVKVVTETLFADEEPVQPVQKPRKSHGLFGTKPSREPQPQQPVRHEASPAPTPGPAGRPADRQESKSKLTELSNLFGRLFDDNLENEKSADEAAE